MNGMGGETNRDEQAAANDLPSYDVAALVVFVEQPDGSMTIETRDRPLDRDGWPARWSDPTYLGDGPWGA